MPLAIRFIRLTLEVDIPVCSRTEDEAHAIARDVLGDKIGLMGDDEPPRVVASDLLKDDLPQFDDETVWGEAVPEDAMTVALLREWLKKRK